MLVSGCDGDGGAAKFYRRQDFHLVAGSAATDASVVVVAELALLVICSGDGALG